ncbi:TPA: molybdopterin-dependent oxidoreductase [Stenotrophomonas maltophilia]|uniref:molybdopterin-containing oxidoreductase family protein n=1 Tax=Cupriavidus pauculus TaxID=82633 RepID=UPI0007808B5F|nr:molybdopterin-dependent oxidoreductase [Cupriavidus pauculus]HDS1530757.1 molybdopterin-dependent oxidoreductase [Stenotrophomonas maltophilia]
MTRSEKKTIRTTCPRDCYDACGIVAIVRDDRVSKVLGDPNHVRAQGALCGKCALAYNGVWLDPERRLTRPLKRVGSKGTARFEAVGWDEALRDIADRLQHIVATHGAHSILQTHYTGICSILAGNFPVRFFNRLGATEVDPDTVCNKAGHDALRMMFGNSFFGFDPRAGEDAECLVIWGANPSYSAPHVHKNWIPKVRQNAKLVVVDPIRHDTAAAADLHLQLRPGTDAQLAFAILHVMHRDGLLDEAFIGRHVLGWEEVADDVVSLDLDAAASVTGVPRASIEQAAQWYGAGRSLLWLGQGVQRQAHAGNVMRSVGLLPAATGNIGRIGTGLLYMNAPPARGVDMDWLNAVHLRPASEHPAMISHMDLAQSLEDPQRSRALFTWNNNIAASSPEQHRLREALKRDDLFHVALDIFQTDTTAYADYVLPAASFLEFDDLLLSYFDYTISAQVQAAAPMGESLSNQEIFRRLAGAMGYADPELHASDASLLAELLQQIGSPIPFADLAEKGTIDWRAEKVNRFEDGVFPTPSGRIEVASAHWEAVGMPRAPKPLADDRPAGGYLRILSPADQWLMNSSYANDSRIAQRLGPQKVWVHPSEAQRRGLSDGQPVTLRNHVGELTVQLALSDTVPEDVALLPKGRWPSLDGANANVNVLNDGTKSDLGESSSVHSIEAEMVAA